MAATFALTFPSVPNLFRSWEYLHSLPLLHVFDLCHSKHTLSGNSTLLTGGLFGLLPLDFPPPLPLDPFDVPFSACFWPFFFPLPLPFWNAATSWISCSCATIDALAALRASARTCGSCENLQSLPLWQAPLSISQQAFFFTTGDPALPFPFDLLGPSYGAIA